ncbi:glycoside hydrolase family 3 protein [Microbulbifer sp. 2201CG32-9]|uniref:glycoside hydrolase family 3 protein n=1 Tax=Microbulbifer sp. 2201CG32-9 TaxID=3232309 RepID=UPI00345BFF46
MNKIFSTGINSYWIISVIFKPALLRRSLISSVCIALVVVLTGCGERSEEAGAALSLREKVAQKLMLDIRYYCGARGQPDRSLEAAGASQPGCKRPVTVLPEDLRELVTGSALGGIVLFADNLENSEQIVRLNRDLQEAALQSSAAQPLLLAIDQEGGRVNRLPRDEATAFAGNMAIGATYPGHGTQFAQGTAAAMAEQVRALGFNVNFAPTLDVNSNPDNPVINVRSYGEAPQMVAALGAASVKAFQRHGVAATVKHFPGHGDTSVDSHTGLPRVQRPLAQAQGIDLLPFAEVIRDAAPALVMSAHIQYPALDNSSLQGEDGESLMVPATLSHKILTGILRDQMGYRGVVVTDALDMAGISDYFSAEQAVVHTFAAGADIALMPIKIRYAEDLPKVEQLIDAVVEAVRSGSLFERDIDTSAARIIALKQRYVDTEWLRRDVEENIAMAHRVLAEPAHRQLADQLARAAVSPVYPPAEGALPVISTAVKSLQVIAPSRAIGEAFRLAIAQVSDAEVELVPPDKALEILPGKAAQVLVVASIVPGESAVEWGGAEDLAAAPQPILDSTQLQDIYGASLQLARARGQKTVFISMRSPYEAAKFHQLADLLLASYDYKAFIGPGGSLRGPVYTALAAALSSTTAPEGRLPVTVQSGSRQTVVGMPAADAPANID